MTHSPCFWRRRQMDEGIQECCFISSLYRLHPLLSSLLLYFLSIRSLSLSLSLFKLLVTPLFLSVSVPVSQPHLRAIPAVSNVIELEHVFFLFLVYKFWCFSLLHVLPKKKKIETMSFAMLIMMLMKLWLWRCFKASQLNMGKSSVQTFWSICSLWCWGTFWMIPSICNMESS